MTSCAQPTTPATGCSEIQPYVSLVAVNRSDLFVFCVARSEWPHSLGIYSGLGDLHPRNPVDSRSIQGYVQSSNELQLGSQASHRCLALQAIE